MDDVRIQSSRLDNIMSCQELLAFSFTYSAVLVSNKSTLDCLYTSMTNTGTLPKNKEATYYSCCKDFAKAGKSRYFRIFSMYWTVIRTCKSLLTYIRKFIKAMVNHKYFQQGILLAILINTLSMGIGMFSNLSK